MEPSVIEEVRLTAYKSFRDAVLPLDDLTIVVGRNGSGKSNALDGLWTLTRLAEGEEIRDAIDGGREGPAVRGGVIGSAPFGESSFRLGCTVRTGGEAVSLDVTVQTEPVAQVVYERLAVGDRELFVTAEPKADSADISARWADGRPGPNPTVTFRASRLLTSQLLSRIPATEAGQQIHLAAARVLAALRSVFVLDPVPHSMRQYVPRQDSLLRRNAENLSAAIASMLEHPDTRHRILSSIEDLNEQDVIDVKVSSSELGDVMLTLTERFGGRPYDVPARQMSDGSLRFLAILVALMQSPTVDTMPEPLASEDALGQTTVVIEELENGLHASQAALLIGLIREEVKRRRVRALATAHSPALLDALSGDEHHSVVVCQRDRDGRSTLTRLVDLPAYVDVIARGGLGKASVSDRLRLTEVPSDAGTLLNDILGASG